jgi:deoxycytidine triphosphate deaminase
MLSDADIARELLSGNLRIEPPPANAQRQPVSVDLRLGDGFLRYRSRSLPVPIGNIPADLTWAKEASPHGVALFPGEFMLATTRERSPWGTTWWAGWRASPRSAASGCRCTPRPG